MSDRHPLNGEGETIDWPFPDCEKITACVFERVWMLATTDQPNDTPELQPDAT